MNDTPDELRALDAKIAINIFGYRRFVPCEPELAVYGFRLGPAWWIDNPNNQYAGADATPHQGVYEAVPRFTTDTAAALNLHAFLVALPGVAVNTSSLTLEGKVNHSATITVSGKVDCVVKRRGHAHSQPTLEMAVAMAAVAACEEKNDD